MRACTSGGREASSVAHACPHFAHVQVITVRLLTSRTQPSCWHLGHGIGSGRPVFGIAEGSRF